MQQFRSQLTRLRNLIEERLPDGGDLYGFAGITRQMLCSAVDVAYALSRDIAAKDDDTHFEVIALKRAGTRTYQDLKAFLEATTPDQADANGFDRFLTDLSLLVEKTKLVYLVINKDGLRDDVEIQTIRSKVASLASSLEELATLRAEYSEHAERAKTALETVTDAEKKAADFVGQVDTWYETSGSQAGELEELHERVTGWEEDFKTRNAEIRVLNEQIAALQTQSQQLNQEFQALVTAGKTNSELLKKLVAENQRLQTEIRQTLEDANREGMAASFKIRKAEVEKNLWRWQIVFVLALPLIAAVAWGLFDPAKLTADWTAVLFRVGVLSPLVWLGWFAARQFSYLSRIGEDYAFKYAASMAYEGFKKATRETDEELERVLLEFSLFNMAQNPIRLYDAKADHASPANEMLDTVLGSLKRMKKVTLEHPKIGKLSVESQGAEEP